MQALLAERLITFCVTGMWPPWLPIAAENFSESIDIFGPTTYQPSSTCTCLAVVARQSSDLVSQGVGIGTWQKPTGRQGALVDEHLFDLS